MTDYVNEAAEMATVVGTCAAGLATRGTEGAIKGVVAGAAFAKATLMAYATDASAVAATAPETAMAVPEAVLFTAATLGAAGAIIGAPKGCHENVEQYYYDQINARIAKTVAAQADMTIGDKISAIESAARHLATPAQSLDQGMIK